MEDKPNVVLSGADGNIYAILGACEAAWRRAKLPRDQWDKIFEEVTNSDSYDKALQTVMKYFEVD